MKFLNLFAYTALIAFISSHNAEAQSPTPTAASAASSTDLPTFNYSLTQESEANRQQLCDSNKAYCASNCGEASPPMNFCNNVTMAWGCGCSGKVPDFKDFQWPINRADCVNRGQACQAICQSNTVSVDKKMSCNQACSTTYTNTCGTASQPAAYYNTTDINMTPAYGPPTSSNNASNGGNNGNNSTLSGSATGSSNSSASGTPAKSDASSLSIAFSIGSAISALAIVAVGMTML